MNKTARTVIIVLTGLCISASASGGLLTAPAGYRYIDTAFSMPAGAWFGGFDVLPNGHFVISDGYSIRQITPAGRDVRTLYTYSSMVYGSFVKYNAANQRIYFGESSSGAIKSISMRGGEAAEVTTLAFNFDLDFWDGVPYASAGNQVYRVDESDGSSDPVAQVGLFSGPVMFDEAGNLIYSPGDDDWSTPRDQSIYRWTAAQVAGAGGGTVLGASDGIVLADNTGPYGFAIDRSGDLLFSETVFPSAIQLLSAGLVQTFSMPVDPGCSITYIRCNAAKGSVSAAVSWYDEYWVQHTVISTLVPVPGRGRGRFWQRRGSNTPLSGPSFPSPSHPARRFCAR